MKNPMFKTSISIIALLFMLASCSEEEPAPDDRLFEYELNFSPIDHTAGSFDIEVAYGINELGGAQTLDCRETAIVYMKKGDAIHIRLSSAKSAMKVQIAPDHYTFVPYNLTLNETLIVEYSREQFK